MSTSVSAETIDHSFIRCSFAFEPKVQLFWRQQQQEGFFQTVRGVKQYVVLYYKDHHVMAISLNTSR